MLEQINKAAEYVERMIERQTAAALARAEENDLDGLITLFAEARAIKDRMKEVLATATEFSEMLANDTVPTAMDTAGLTTASHRLGRVSLVDRTSATIIDRQQAYAWLRGHGLEALIVETVNAQTLSATARDLLEKGEELPDTCFKTRTHTQATFTAPGTRRKKDKE